MEGEVQVYRSSSLPLMLSRGVPQSGRLNLYLCLKCMPYSFSLCFSLLSWCFVSGKGGVVLVTHCCKFIHICSTSSAINTRPSVLLVNSLFGPCVLPYSPIQPNPPSPVFLKLTSQLSWWIICWWIIVLDAFSWILLLVIEVKIKTNNLIINDFATYSMCI